LEIELQTLNSCGFELGFLIQMVHFEFVKLSFYCLVSEFWVLNYKFLVFAILGLGFLMQMVHFEFVKLSF